MSSKKLTKSKENDAEKLEQKKKSNMTVRVGKHSDLVEALDVYESAFKMSHERQTSGFAPSTILGPNVSKFVALKQPEENPPKSLVTAISPPGNWHKEGHCAAINFDIEKEKRLTAEAALKTNLTKAMTPSAEIRMRKMQKKNGILYLDAYRGIFVIFLVNFLLFILNISIFLKRQ